MLNRISIPHVDTVIFFEDVWYGGKNTELGIKILGLLLQLYHRPAFNPQYTCIFF